MVEYSPGYAADHWCSKGHVILCLTGGLDIELAMASNSDSSQAKAIRLATAILRTAPRPRLVPNSSSSIEAEMYR